MINKLGRSKFLCEKSNIWVPVKFIVQCQIPPENVHNEQTTKITKYILKFHVKQGDAYYSSSAF